MHVYYGDRCEIPSLQSARLNKGGTHVVLFYLTDHLPSLIRHVHGEDIDQAARKRKLQDAHIIV